MLNIGDVAPEIDLFNQSDERVLLSGFKGRKVVLFFYPRDNTPGCTREAIGFTENVKQFEDKNTVILGISKDSTESHAKFCEKHDLGVDLLSDVDTSVQQEFGVWREKMNYGKKYMGTVRTTFLIDEEGVILNIWNNVRVDGHVDAVLGSI